MPESLRPHRRLRRRILLAFAGFTLLLALAFGFFAAVMVYAVEDALLAGLLEDGRAGCRTSAPGAAGGRRRGCRSSPSTGIRPVSPPTWPRRGGPNPGAPSFPAGRAATTT